MRGWQRRRFLGVLAGGTIGLAGCRQQNPARRIELPSSRDRWIRFPGKVPMRLLTDRPPQLETPWRYFEQDFTPNEAFFVRWHLEGIPTKVDLDDFRLRIQGHVERPLELSVADLRRSFEPSEVIAVGQCSGNSRSLFRPNVPGGQWRHGAMGNARWRGVRLRDLLEHARIRLKAVDVSFSGLDVAPLPSVPGFAKSLSVEQALHPDILVAYEMNGSPLPLLNGFPLRLVVPGWYATYWVKALARIEVLPQPFHSFWMDTAYRIPANTTGAEHPDQLVEHTIPIHRFRLHSLIVRPEPGERVAADQDYPVQGLALDSGSGITRVEISADGGTSWSGARLDAELGRYSWRRWRFAWRPPARGRYRLMVRAYNRAGEQQTAGSWNRSGFMRSDIEAAEVEAV